MRSSRLIVHVCLLAIVLTFSGVSLAQQGPLAGFDEYAEKARQDWEVPGMAIAIVKDDKVVYAKGFGVKKLGESAPVDERTIFAIGSSSKAFTSAALAMLVDEGKIKWDDRVSKYIPEFELYDPYVTRELTIRDILTHRSGIERGEFVWYATENSRAEILRRARFIKPTLSFRGTFGYQNIMYLAAGTVVERVTGKTWDQFIAERIFTPLGMTASSTSIKAFKPGENVASPHAKVGDKVVSIPWRNVDNIAPAGSINSNVLDIGQWLRLQIGQGTFEGKKLFGPAVAREMHMGQTIIRLEGAQGLTYPEAHFLNYGMGWFLSDYKGRKLIEHGGAIDGMRAEVAVMPEEKLGVVILTNMNGSIVSMPLLYRIIDSFIGGPQKDHSGELLAKYKPLIEAGAAAEKKAEAERVANTKPTLDLSNYVGTYNSELYGDVKITMEDGKLKLAFGPAFVSPLEHWNYDTFRASFFAAGDAKPAVTFSIDAKGKVDTLTLGLPGMTTYPFKRVAEPIKTAGSTNVN